MNKNKKYFVGIDIGQNLLDIQAAIIALGTGARVVSVIVEGKSITYSQVQIDDLKKLKAEIISELSLSSGSTRKPFFLSMSEKGL